mmetsp:Transcript_49790/g.112058  ORF Transcript_49790/g.112058 Transcript_49790/m.112058 type:complete len:639 (-) Transcript_49790:74-1990(-)
MVCGRGQTKSPTAELFLSLVKVEGSILPWAACFALPCAVLATYLKLLQEDDRLPGFLNQGTIIEDNAAYSGFSVAMSFLLVFRTGQAYGRYWEGVTLGHRMFAEWFDFAGACIAFSRYSKAPAKQTLEFKHRLVRLLSLLHATAAATLRNIDESTFELIDLSGLEEELVDALFMESKQSMRTTIIGQWILELVMEGYHHSILAAPAPILSRAFQEFANGCVAFHDATKMESSRFPFPYTQMSAIMLISHWFATPLVMCQWVIQPHWVFALTFLQVLIFWALYFTAVEIEHPFKPGSVSAKYEATWFQREFNEKLLLLINPRTRRIPTLSPVAQLDVFTLCTEHTAHTFAEVADNVDHGQATKRMTRRKRLWRKLRYKLQHGKTHSRSTFKNNLKDDLQRNSSFGWNASLTSWEDPVWPDQDGASPDARSNSAILAARRRSSTAESEFEAVPELTSRFRSPQPEAGMLSCMSGSTFDLLTHKSSSDVARHVSYPAISSEDPDTPRADRMIEHFASLRTSRGSSNTASEAHEHALSSLGPRVRGVRRSREQAPDHNRHDMDVPDSPNQARDVSGHHAANKEASLEARKRDLDLPDHATEVDEFAQKRGALLGEKVVEVEAGGSRGSGEEGTPSCLEACRV